MSHARAIFPLVGATVAISAAVLGWVGGSRFRSVAPNGAVESLPPAPAALTDKLSAVPASTLDRRLQARREAFRRPLAEFRAAALGQGTSEQKRRLFDDWARRDAADLVAWSLSRRDDSVSASLAITALLAVDPAAALRLAKGRIPGQDLQVDLGEALFSTEPATRAAVEGLLAMRYGTLNVSAGQASEALAEIETRAPEKLDAVHVNSEQWMSSAPAEAIRWLRAHRPESVEDAVSSWTWKSDPAAPMYSEAKGEILAWIDSVEPRRLSGDAVIFLLRAGELERAGKVIDAAPEEHLRKMLRGATTAKLADRDVDAARAFAESQPQGPQRDDQLALLASHLFEKSPEAGLAEWARLSPATGAAKAVEKALVAQISSAVADSRGLLESPPATVPLPSAVINAVVWRQLETAGDDAAAAWVETLPASVKDRARAALATLPENEWP